jgi:hypothetical protein
VRVKIYSQKSWLPGTDTHHVHLLYPVWGEHVEAVYRQAGVYAKYNTVFNSIFELVDDLKEADILLIPADYKHYKKQQCLHLIDSIVQLAESERIPALLFFKSDDDSGIHIQSESLITFRTSFYKSTRRPKEYAMPVWSGDIVREVERLKLPAEPFPADPIISFCGQVSRRSGWRGRIRFLEYMLIKRGFPGFFKRNEFLRRAFSELRKDVLSTFKSSRKLRTNFIERLEYFGGAWLGWGRFNVESYETSRRQYLENMISAPYVVCVRGGGNYSLRIYEAMSLGRIPLLIDTDCVLPWEDFVDWHNHIIRIPLCELEKAGEIVENWHNRHSREELELLASENRLIWETYLSPHGFFSKLHLILKGYGR